MSEHHPAVDPVFEPTPDDWNPIQVTDYPAEYRRLRAGCPVAHTSDYDDFWGLMRYADVQKGARDWRSYTSGQPFVEFPEFMKSIPIQSNPPEHTFFRRFLSRYFTPERVAMLVPAIEEVVSKSLDPLVAQGEADMIDEFGRTVPQQVLAKFLMLSDDAWVTMAESLAKAEAVRHDLEKHREVNKTLWNPTVEALIEDRRANPLNPEIDIMSGAMQLEPGGRPITHEELVAIGVQIFSAGADTTTAAIGSIVGHLAAHPEDQQQLRDDPDLIPSAVEELLRLAPPLHQLGRHSTKSVTACGRTIPEGVKVGLNLYSANRDEDKFDRSEEYVVDRSPNPHLTFGHGPHQCMGSPIAREELKTTVRQLMAKTTSFELTGQPVSNGRPLRTGWASVPVRFR